MNGVKTIVLVLKEGKDFAFRDVELIARHIKGKWNSSVKPRIICLWSKASQYYDLGGIELIPLGNDYPGTWSRIQLYSPEMEQYKPFLYIDLDTVVVQSIENIFDLVKDESKFITLEDFWQRGQLATGLVWFPKNCEKTQKVWNSWKGPVGNRMDYFLRKVVTPDTYWQRLTTTIVDFKEKGGKLLSEISPKIDLVCFHGKPRIFDVANASISLQWVKDYVNQDNFVKSPKVSVIIPYAVDRGWLNDAINSVPTNAQLLISQGEGNWPYNFNKVFLQVEGKYVKFLHEDDMLTENCIEDSIKTFEETGADFIHGKAIELYQDSGKKVLWQPSIKNPTLKDMLKKNTIHSVTLMYKYEVFEKIGLFDETLNTAEEFEFNLRCLKAGLKIGYSPYELGIYRRHPLQKVRMVATKDKDKEREMVRNKYRA